LILDRSSNISSNNDNAFIMTNQEDDPAREAERIRLQEMRTLERRLEEERRLLDAELERQADNAQRVRDRYAQWQREQDEEERRRQQ
jgi:hypothetical protein